jgi:multidrug efflux pump subunit AcrA (membrane-fusion protein)
MQTYPLRRYLPLILLWIGALLLAGCRGGEEPLETTPTALEAVDEGGPISASGEVVPRQWQNVGFTTNGIIDEILVERGERVSAGQELARLYEGELQLAHAEAIAELRQSEARLADLQAQPRPEILSAAQAALANARANYDRLDRANARDVEMAAAQAQIDSAQVALEAIEKGAEETEIRAAAADVQAAILNVDQAQAAIERAVLRAPHAGQVVEIYRAEGDAASPGTPLLLLADLDDLQVATTDLSELDVTHVRVGDPAEVSIDALPEAALAGTVAEIAAQGTPGAGVTYRVVITLEEIPEGLRWGMTAFVTLRK